MEWDKDKIRAFRKKLSLTQPQFAKLLNTSNVLISYWETGKLKPAGISQKALSLVAEKENLEEEIEKILSKEDRISKEKIRSFREKLGLSQIEFAESLGRDASTVSYWESGERSPCRESIRRIKVLAAESGIELDLSSEAQAGKIPESEGKTDD